MSADDIVVFEAFSIKLIMENPRAKGKFISKAILYVVIALIAVRLLSSALKLAAIVAIIACAIYFAWKEAKR